MTHPSSFETDRPWRCVLSVCDGRALRGRLRFGEGGNSAPFPSALAVWGAGPEAPAALDAALAGAWRAG